MPALCFSADRKTILKTEVFQSDDVLIIILTLKSALKLFRLPTVMAAFSHFSGVVDGKHLMRFWSEKCHFQISLA